MTTTDKIEKLHIMDCTEAFAVPGEDSIIDVINPNTGRSWCYDQTLEQIKERYPKAEIVNCDEHFAAKAERQDSPLEWQETTREQYEEMLNVLPPADFNRTFTAFLVGEPWDHHALSGRPRYQGFEIREGKYWQSSRPMTRKEFSRAYRSRVEADARLIASAPDLLEACQMLLIRLEGCGPDVPRGHVYDLAKAAITKATS